MTMAEWPTVPIGELFRLKQGTYLRPEEMAEEQTDQFPFPVYGANGVIGHSNRKMYSDRTTLISCRGANCGVVHYTVPNVWISNNSIACVPSAGVDPTFYYYVCLNTDFGDVITGSAQPQITITNLSSKQFIKPPLPVQRRIAGILSTYDELMENSQRRIRILEAMARALYREWFVHFRFPGHETHPRVASPLGHIPKGWEVVSIDEVCARVTDGSHFSPKSVDEGLPMASSKDMHDWGLNLDTARMISPEDFADLVRNDCKPKKNDVLITKDGANYLKYIFVTRAEQEVVLLSSVAMLRPNARINPHLLAAILKEPENKGRLKNYVTGAAIPRVILKDFKRFELLLPSKEVQTAWAKIAEPMTEQIWRLIDKIQNLRRTRDLLLPRLLSGQVELATN